MAEFVGNNAYCQWVTTSGTVTLSTDYRTFSKSGNINEVDKSAGADTERTYLPTLKDRTYQGTFLHTGSTTEWSLLSEGTSGTLTWGEMGTTSGLPKHVQAMFIRDSNLNFGYEELAIWDLTFRPSATESYSTWT